MGFPETANLVSEKAFSQHLDSSRFLNDIQRNYSNNGNYLIMEERFSGIVKKDSTNLYALYNLVYAKIIMNKYFEAVKLFPTIEKCEIEKYGKPRPNLYMGYCLSKTGDSNAALWHFENSAEEFKNDIETRNTLFVNGYRAHVYLAGCYACLGEKEKALD